MQCFITEGGSCFRTSHTPSHVTVEGLVYTKSGHKSKGGLSGLRPYTLIRSKTAPEALDRLLLLECCVCHPSYLHRHGIEWPKALTVAPEIVYVSKDPTTPLTI